MRVIMRLPLADSDGSVDHLVIGAEARLEPGEIDEGLEGGAGLAERLRRTIELAAAIVAAADESAPRAVMRHRDKRALARLRALAVALQRLGERRLGRGLKARIERRPDGEILIVEPAEIGELLDDPIGKIAAAGAVRGDHGELRGLLL